MGAAGEAVCNDHDVCTRDRCLNDACVHTPNLYGDIDQNDLVNVFDLLCILEGFGGKFDSCSSLFEEVDIYPCSGNGTINVFDFFAVLNGIEGADPCCTGVIAVGRRTPAGSRTGQPQLCRFKLVFQVHSL